MAKFTFDFQKNKKQTAILVALAAALALLAYLNFILIPHAASVISAFGKISRQKAEVKGMKADISMIGKLKNDLAGYDGRIERYIKMLPAEQEIPSLLESLAVMARDSNVRIVAITPVSGKEAEGEKGRVYQEMPIQISARSGYHELGRFLANLESSPRFMKVVDIEIRGNKTAPKKHDIDLMLTTYVLVKGK